MRQKKCVLQSKVAFSNDGMAQVNFLTAVGIVQVLIVIRDSVVNLAIVDKDIGLIRHIDENMNVISLLDFVKDLQPEKTIAKNISREIVVESSIAIISFVTTLSEKGMRPTSEVKSVFQ